MSNSNSSFDGKVRVSKYRDGYAIIKRILEHANIKPQVKSELMMEARLSHAQLEDYVTFCLEKNLLEKFFGESKGKQSHKTVLYKTTRKGVELLDAIEKVNEIINNGK